LNHRDRLFTALEHREPDLVPVADLSIDPPIVEAILGRKLGFGLTKFGGNVSGKEAGKAWYSAIGYRRALVEACIKLDFDGAPFISDYSIVTRDYEPKFLDGQRFIDQWGRVMQTSERAKTTYFVDGIIKSPEDLDRLELPDGFHPDVMEMMKEIIRPFKDKDIVVMGQVHSGWHLAFQARGGIDKISIDFYRNPDFARRLIEKYARAFQRLAEAMIKAGVEVLWVTDDYADNNGPLVNPKLLRQYEFQNLKRIVEIARKYNVPVMKHSDGNLYMIIEDLIDTGIKGLHPVEPGAMDLRDVKERYGGRICLAGNVDCRYVLPFGGRRM